MQITNSTKNILLLIELLKGLQLIKNDREFCTAINLLQQSLNAIKTGTRNFPKGKIGDVVIKYDVSVEFINKGSMPVFQEGSANEKYNQIIYDNPYLRSMLVQGWSHLSEVNIPAPSGPDKDQQIAQLQAMIRDKDLLIENQQKVIKYLETEITQLKVGK